MDEGVRESMRAQWLEDAYLFRTWVEAEHEIAQLFGEYTHEMHPSTNEAGKLLFDYFVERVMLGAEDKPRTVNVKQLLDEVFVKYARGDELEVSKLKFLLLALLESWQRYTLYGHRHAKPGQSCAREVDGKIVCRYQYPKDFYFVQCRGGGVVCDDGQRTDLRNLRLTRSDSLSTILCCICC